MRWVFPWLLVMGMMTAARADLPPVVSFHTAGWVSVPPEMDGRLDDACWQTLPVTRTFYKYWVPQVIIPPLQTALQLGYDAQGVYLGTSMWEQEPGRLKALIREHENPRLWTDDCAEVCFDPGATGTSFFQFVVNPLGFTNTRRGLGGGMIEEAWAPQNWWRAATSRDEKGWYFEFFIPWKVFKTSPARPNDLWRFCMMRYSWSSGNNLATTAVGAANNRVAFYGWLLFLPPEGKPAPARLTESLGPRIPGDWLICLGEEMLIKTGRMLGAKPTRVLLSELRTAAQEQIDECIRVVKGEETAREACRQAEWDLAALSMKARDAGEFQSTRMAVEGVVREVEKVEYEYLMRKLLTNSS
ncbi:MAG: hypothetical protein GX100_07150 [candidate division WS1 bacterium]|nr:hypothetical protein [candidate division WS1 bacterium]